MKADLEILAFLNVLGFFSQKNPDKIWDRIPNAEKLAIIRAKTFKIWAKYTATFTCKWGSVYFPN